MTKIYGGKEFGRFIEIFNHDYFNTLCSIDEWKSYFEFDDE